MNFEVLIDVNKLFTFAVWVVVAYMCVCVSIIIDLCAAFYKCKRLGVAWVSDKMKRTSTKAGKYFLPMLALSVVDCIAFCVVPYPIFTLLFGVVNALTEWRSVFENTHTKEEQRKAANTINLVVQNKDELTKIIGELINKGGDDGNKC